MIKSYWHTDQVINEHLLNEEMNEYVFVFVVVLFIFWLFMKCRLFLIQLLSFLKYQHELLQQMLSFIPQHVQLSESPFFFSVMLNLSLTKLVFKPLKSFSWQITMIIIKPQKCLIFCVLIKYN